MHNPGSINEQQLKAVPSRTSHPGSVTILALGVLIITAINLTRLILSIRYWDFLATWPGVSPLYMVMTGFIWTLAGLPLLWGLWRGKYWAPRLMQAVALTYALYYWLDQVFLVDHPVSGAEGARRALLPVNWQFAIGVTVLCLAYTAWTLNRARVKAYFGVAGADNERNKAKNNDLG
ncbi:MAG: hypothetical protein A2136_02625 [Chloroflexi bacterium RBG_16_54_11]|nr:MAG: hypothetical protein A2136_02625 [Chloroflexi bacterium RBG_16_54_11]